MECKLFVLLAFNCLLQVCYCIGQASFYGNSYIAVPFKEAKSSTDIYFKFRTHLSDSLILLVTGHTDYCMVKLENSRIRVSINLGAGENELFSPASINLNDFKWHEVTIQRSEANLTMIIDKTLKVQKHLPGKFFELNVHYGLYVGDHKKKSTDIFLGHFEKFRGCLSELKYNGIMVLEQARNRQSNTIVQGVTWNCAAEFDAPVDRPISFVEDDAYIAISQSLTHSKEIKIQFEIKSIMNKGLLFYNPGEQVKLEYFSIDIYNSTVRAIVKIGDKVLNIKNSVVISDGQWHKISFRLTQSHLELVVDDKKAIETNRYGFIFKLRDTSYLGGIETSKRFRATSKGCSESCDNSFKGCIRHLSVFDVKKGLPDAQISEGLMPGCIWHYPCLQHPCDDNGICVQQGLDAFQCQCKNEFCVKNNYTEAYKVFSKNSLAIDLEILSVEPLQLLEGQSQIITTNNLHMILDYQKYGIKDSGIHFFIDEEPEHGSITIDVWPHEKNSFSLNDIAKDKVHYVHDGSEHTHDSFSLEVQFFPADTFVLPSYLQGLFKFRLSVTVVPTNDPPLLTISESTVLRVVQGTKKLITPQILQAVDPDNSADQLVYNVIKCDSGYFENVKKTGAQLSSFTQELIDKEKIYYVDRSSSTSLNDSYISIQVSDGIETSPLYKLRVSVSPQHWRLENNTGIIVLHQTESIITPYNLSFTSNVNNVDYQASFSIVKKPQFGVIEVEKNVNSWEASDTFSSTDLRQHRVRYRHLQGKPEYDEFQFRTSLEKSAVYTFRLTFTKCTLYNVIEKVVVLNDVWEYQISSEHLLYETKPSKGLTSITYVITKPPQYGFIFSSVSKYRLKSCDSFTQEDIVSKNIKFKLYQKGYSNIIDGFSFVVLSPGCNNITGNFTFHYLPSHEARERVTVQIKEISVDEGASTPIDLNHFNLQANFVTNLFFNVTQKPQNGILQLKLEDTVKNNSLYFSLNDVKNGYLHYLHDGSETQSDSFKFLALAASSEENFEYVDNVKINVQLKNDNSPIRKIDKIFHVVVGGERILTGNDLRYVDLDLNTPTSTIVYTCRESSNGQFYNIRNYTTKILEFTQQDLDKSLIIFKHKGPEFGKVRLWVTDGQYHVTGVLEVQASAPFIHITMSKKIVVEQGKITVITKDYLSYSTNLYAYDADVFYEITQKASFGKIVYSKTLQILNNFTQEDVNAGLVSYLNEVSSVNADEIGIKVRCKDAVNLGQLGIWILPFIYWEPLEIKNVKKLSVEESTSALITKQNLEVVQSNVPPSSIAYFIEEIPEYGRITILSDGKNEPINIHTFTQDMVNDNKILFIQSGTNQTKDRIIFNVTNGIVWHKRLELNIEIIPEHLYLGTNNLNVSEGGIATITTHNLYILTDYYKSKLAIFKIMNDVQYGCIQVHKRCTKTKTFTQKELKAGVVRYAHDGSENLSDGITLIAEVSHKKSVPVNLQINIVPVYDQKPKIANNTGMTMWEGGVSVITNSMLAAVDDDRPHETLMYHIQGCWWGSVSLKSDPNNSLSSFTQEMIDANEITFHHQNGTEARFKFKVSDGLHTTKEAIFQISTKPVYMHLNSKPLHIFPLQRKYLTASNLLTTISDLDRTVQYEIITAPSLGHLMVESESTGLFRVVSMFTQDDLNNSRVFYEHTHRFSDLYANDSFVFNVKAHLAPSLLNQMLKIDISVSSGGLDAYVHVPKITVDEGGSTNIPLNLSDVVFYLENHASLRSPIIHVSAGAPSHGQVFLQTNMNVTTFTQQQLESGQVYYKHDHSDSTGDNIHISLYLIPGYIILCNVTVPVIVNPINDQPFTLITPAPNFVVVQGENHTITRHELATEDVDTPPEKLKYDLIKNPLYGKLILLPEVVQVTSFSQADIDKNHLLYIHEGSSLQDSFQFRVWDGKFRPQWTSLNIMVLPVNITITAGLPVYIQQSSDVVFLSEKQFYIETNADKYKVNYTVKQHPKHGVLYVKDNPTLSFTQSDLLDENVMYLQTDMTTANDTFIVAGEIVAGNTSYGNEIEVSIKVQPLMQLHNFTVLSGKKNQITLHVLDASPLAKLTNSNPRYTIISLPKYGQIRKVIRSSGENRNVLDTAIINFTHEDIQSGLIYLIVKDIEVPWNGIEDKMRFMIAAPIFQPAITELKINIKSSLLNDLYSTLAGPSDPAGHEGGLHLASPNMTRDYLLIVSMVAGVVILGVAVIVIIKCRSLEVEELNKEEQCLQPIPLPRPPDRLMSSSLQLKQNMDGYMPSLSATALPQCKVTPLGRSELESPHACYPYGVEEHTDDWSSCDASDPPCPSKNIMLRRNQYWV